MYLSTRYVEGDVMVGMSAQPAGFLLGIAVTASFRSWK